jgi:hypothetical protein
MKRLLVVAGAAAVLALAGGALAGEVKGPPGTPCGPGTTTTCGTGSTDRTGAPEHSNSACSYSGQNDMNPDNGPTDFHVQSPGQNVRNGLTPPGVPGHGLGPDSPFPNGCRGGSNPENPPSP